MGCEVVTAVFAGPKSDMLGKKTCRGRRGARRSVRWKERRRAGGQAYWSERRRKREDRQLDVADPEVNLATLQYKLKVTPAQIRSPVSLPSSILFRHPPAPALTPPAHSSNTPAPPPPVPSSGSSPPLQSSRSRSSPRAQPRSTGAERWRRLRKEARGRPTFGGRGAGREGGPRRGRW